MPRPTRSAALVALLAVQLSCAGLGRTPASDEERRAYADALAVIESDPAQAAERLERFVGTWPRGPLSDDAGEKLGELALARGERDEALRRFYAVARNHPNGNRADPARIAAAALEHERGNRQIAQLLLDQVRLSRLSRPDRRDAYRLLVNVAEDPALKLRWLSRLRAETEDEAALALVDVEIDQILAGLDARDLLRAADEIGRQVPAARALLAAAERSLDEGDTAGAQALLERAMRLPLAFAYAPRLAAVRDRLLLRQQAALGAAELPRFSDLAERPPLDVTRARGTLGVVLPLSGPFARFGERSLDGVLLAAGIFGGAAGNPDVHLRIRDSAGRPEQAAAAVRELAAHEDVVAIVGPLLAGESEAAAEAAERAGVPLLALTARDEIAHERAQAFRLRTMPREEVQVLVEHAMREFGAQTFAILYPRDAYGRGLRSLFWDEVEASGGEVVGIASYEPDATDFADPIRRLVGYVMLTPRERELLKKREEMERRARRLPPEEALLLREEARGLVGDGGAPLPPIVDFDALFIPESHEKVVLIAPQLAFHEAVGTRLLGPAEWYDPKLTQMAQRHVEGALFTAQFYPESLFPPVQRFTAAFRSQFGDEPDLLSAQGFDAANLALLQLARGRSSREALREGLLGTEAFPGVTGILSMRADGNARKRPFLLAVERGQIVQVE